MVRIIGIDHLEQRRKLLQARSEIHRQTLALEIASLRFKAARAKRNFGSFKTVFHFLGLAVPVATFFLDRRRSKTNGRDGMLSRLFSGLKVAGGLASFFRNSPHTDGHPETGRSRSS
jgi:hypothetical protein